MKSQSFFFIELKYCLVSDIIVSKRFWFDGDHSTSMIILYKLLKRSRFCQHISPSSRGRYSVKNQRVIETIWINEIEQKYLIFVFRILVHFLNKLQESLIFSYFDLIRLWMFSNSLGDVIFALAERFIRTIKLIFFDTLLANHMTTFK